MRTSLISLAALSFARGDLFNIPLPFFGKSAPATVPDLLPAEAFSESYFDRFKKFVAETSSAAATKEPAAEELKLVTKLIDDFLFKPDSLDTLVGALPLGSAKAEDPDTSD